MTKSFRVHGLAAARRRARAGRAWPVVVTKVPPVVWAEALRLAGGDVRRLVVRSDGSVLVANQPRSPR